MLRTLILIPESLAGIPTVGFGWLLLFWGILCVTLLGYLATRQGLNNDTLSYLPMMLIIGCVIVFVLPNMVVEEHGVRGIPIRGYGVMLLLGVASGVGLAAHRAQRQGLNPEVIYSLAVWVTVLGILGARVFFVWQYWENFQADTLAQTLKNVFSITEGGLVVYGSLIGAMIGFALFIYRNQLPPFAIADLIAPSLLLGMFFGRIGCLFNGCCYGGICDYPWAITFPEDSPAYHRQAETGELFGFRIAEGTSNQVVVAAIRPGTQAAQSGIKIGDILLEINQNKIEPLEHQDKKKSLTAFEVANHYLRSSLYPREQTVITTQLKFAQSGILNLSLPARPDSTKPIHPTQLYSSLNALIFCLLIIAYYPFRKTDGEVIALTLASYAFTRFLLEIIRTDEGSFQGTGLTVSQNVSLIIFAYACGLLIFLKSRPNKLFLPVPESQIDDSERGLSVES